MLHLITLTCLLSYCQGFSIPNESFTRIIGGKPADISEIPYQISLQRVFHKTNFHVCGGNIIRKDAILTAAHCVNKTPELSPEDFRIRAGSNLTHSGGQFINVSKFIVHPKYDDLIDYDIALIFLSKPIVLGKKTAMVKLPKQDEEVKDGAIALTSGWGDVKEGGPSSKKLLKVDIPIVGQETCLKAYKDTNPVTERMICAGYLDEGGKGACNGDSGGPLTVDGVLMGVTSWSEGCVRPGRPTVYTRVAKLRNWIDSHLNEYKL